MSDIIPNGLTNPIGVPHEMDLQIVDGPSTIPFPITLGDQGGIGFRLTGGIIVVTATPAGVDIGFDRPMSYDGTFGPNPPTAPFNISQPTLDSTARSLDVPVTVSALVPSVVSVVAAPLLLSVTFAQDVTLTVAGTNPSNWVVTGPGGAVVLTVSVLGSVVTLSTTAQNNGGSYYLVVAQGLVQNSFPYENPAANMAFTGVNSPLTVTGCRIIDATDVVVIFSRTVIPSTATVPANYVFSPPLLVDVVERISDTQYLLRTGRQQPNQTYSVTVSNVQALDGTVI
jgi:hypothetical protein